MIKNIMRRVVQTSGLVLIFTWCACHAEGQPFDPAGLADLHGGLVVQLGARETRAAAEMSLTGRYLIHVLDPDLATIQSARSRLRQDGHYGLAWAEQSRNRDRLPYAENMVNLVLVLEYTVPVEELSRVLTPGGKVVVKNSALLTQSQLEAGGLEMVSESGSELIARKPWPQGMDIWSHPRHAADGNAVSHDTLVGPPERVRWIAAATSEVEGMVTAGGRNFYGGTLARDSFNGLRLWHSDLIKGENDSEVFDLPRLSRDGARPIASDHLLFATLRNRPVALDAATGQVVVEFGDTVDPTAVIHDGKRFMVANRDSVHAYDVNTGEEIWEVAGLEPRNVVADGEVVSFVHGQARRGDETEVVTLNAETGTVHWRRSDFPWLTRVTRTVLAKGELVFELSTLTDHDAGNAIHVVSAATGEHLWSMQYPPGSNHMRQARAMFVKDDLWILHGGKINSSDQENMKRERVQVSALDPLTGKTRVTYSAGLTHCFPPVATTNFMFSGEMDLTNLSSGEVIANRITKANCSRENGWVPANGLVYTTPKHCTCWPMLRGFVALAPTLGNEATSHLDVDELNFVFEKGPAVVDPAAAGPQLDDWPMYRQNRWRSAGSKGRGPTTLNRIWTARWANDANDWKKATGPILHDWRDNPVVKGPLSAPTIANGVAYVTRPDAHELTAIDTSSGEVSWRFTANGRIDTPPTIHRGLCLFGTAAGWVHALRADTGESVWRLRAAPSDQRIVACGQVESPWPVPGAVLVMDEVAYFAAGRQALADGGILVFAVDPMTGQRHWVRRIDSVPQRGFYENSGLEFDPFDILHAEGDGLAMSRWVMSLDGTKVDVDKWNAFARLNTGAGEVWVPRGSWTYSARHQDRFRGEAPRRPLVAFRDDNVYSSLNGTTNVFRREFDLEQAEQFDSQWITGWKAAQTARDGGTPYRTYRIAKNATWMNDPFMDPDADREKLEPGTQLSNRIHAMALAGDGKLYVVHQDGRLKVLSTSDGNVVLETKVPPPAWDGLAIAENRLYLSTQSGELLCLGD